MQYSLNHPALDYWKDVVYRKSLEGKEGYEEANNIHTIGNLVGAALTSAGNISTKDWVTTIKQLADHLDPNKESKFDREAESAAHLTELNRRITNPTYGMKNFVDAGQGHVYPRRDTEGMDALYGPRWNTNKAEGLKEMILSLEQNIPGFLKIIDNPDIFGSEMLEGAIIEGKLKLF